ncbi:hypothetical protein CPT_Marzo_229 [Stenotrophomonas phage Marzo]|nr:hypothetical protein CPT_Marzo_229 [Stenotrophomonas phage Marzo]
MDRSEILERLRVACVLGPLDDTIKECNEGWPIGHKVEYITVDPDGGVYIWSEMPKWARSVEEWTDDGTGCADKVLHILTLSDEESQEALFTVSEVFYERAVQAAIEPILPSVEARLNTPATREEVELFNRIFECFDKYGVGATLTQIAAIAADIRQYQGESV